ncbi:hypothetical protein U1Q18_034342 [Sarracenia purpurea var. burkii]
MTLGYCWGPLGFGHGYFIAAAAHMDGLDDYGSSNTSAALKCKEWASTGFSLQFDFAVGSYGLCCRVMRTSNLNWIWVLTAIRKD